MLLKLKSRIDKEFLNFANEQNKSFATRNISPLLYQYINDFILREGKRIRPILFVIGYLGFAKKESPGLYRSALSIELLHDFMLVHDDVIDKSDTRRGKPSMHKMFNNFLGKYRSAKFTGQDLAIVAGDAIYAMGLYSFLAIKEDPKRKEEALKQLIRAALYTGSGEFIELLYGAEDISKINKEGIYKIYDYKTAYYTFASPLAIGAILAGARDTDINKLIEYGMCLGRAFQIKDDILGMFAEEKKTGKSALSDLREAKKTLLIWHAYKVSGSKNKSAMRRIFSQKNSSYKDLLEMRRIINEAQGVEFAKGEIRRLLKKAQEIIQGSGIKLKYKKFLKNYCSRILKV